MINVQIETDPKLVKLKEGFILKLVSEVMKSENIKNAEILLIFTTDNILLELKKKYFNQDHYTDVIAFRLNDYKNEQIEGEIYISLVRAKENATVYKEPYGKEVSRLIIHACLHLIGFNDETEKQKIEMTELENKFLSNIEWRKIF